MTLLADIKASLRISSDAFDAEAQMLIDAALYDMERAGVNPALLQPSEGDISNSFVKQAVTAWCKANFGYDNPEAVRFEGVYDRILNSLLNSSENIAAKEDAEPGPEPEPEPEPEPTPDPQPETEG